MCPQALPSFLLQHLLMCAVYLQTSLFQHTFTGIAVFQLQTPYEFLCWCSRRLVLASANTTAALCITLLALATIETVASFAHTACISLLALATVASTIATASSSRSCLHGILSVIHFISHPSTYSSTSAVIVYLHLIFLALSRMIVHYLCKLLNRAQIRF